MEGEGEGQGRGQEVGAVGPSLLTNLGNASSPDHLGSFQQNEILFSGLTILFGF